jgi:hypothetical protein
MKPPNGPDFLARVENLVLRQILFHLENSVYALRWDVLATGRVEEHRAELPIVDDNVNLLAPVAVRIDDERPFRAVPRR